MTLKKIMASILAVGAAVTMLTVPVSASWQQDGIGWWYQKADKSFVKAGFQLLEGKWYYFDANGYIKRGWVQENGEWYFMDSSGAMKTGWLKDGENWYYLSENDAFGFPVGAMHTGTFYSGKDYYFFGNNGVMATGEVEIEGGKSLYGADGKLKQMSYIYPKMDFDSSDDWTMTGGGGMQFLLREDDPNVNIIALAYENEEELFGKNDLAALSEAYQLRFEQDGYTDVRVTAKMLSGDWDAAASFDIRATKEVLDTSVDFRIQNVVVFDDGLAGTLNYTATAASYLKYASDFNRMVKSITLQNVEEVTKY